jgi:hypothetical protein
MFILSRNTTGPQASDAIITLSYGEDRLPDGNFSAWVSALWALVNTSLPVDIKFSFKELTLAEVIQVNGLGVDSAS